MLDIIAVYGLMTSFALASLILISLYINPRIWIRHLPIEIQRKIPEKSKMEKRQSLVVLILFLTVLIVLPSIAVVNYGNQMTLVKAFIITYNINFLFNITDLLLIDWLIICTITPSFIKFNGVDETVYKNYRKHLMDFFRGAIIIIVPSVFSSLFGIFIIRYI